MKKLVMAMALSAFAASAYAGNGNKADLLHCGCNEAGTDLAYVAISVKNTALRKR